MAFPPVKWCIVCEDVRHERDGLLSLMGFYGVLPDVQIKVRDFNLPLGRLSFVWMAEGPSDGKKHRTKFQVLGPQGEIVLPGSESTTASSAAEGTKMRIQTAMTAMNPRLPGPGHYQVLFEVDDQEHFKRSFSVVHDPQAM